MFVCPVIKHLIKSRLQGVFGLSKVDKQTAPFSSFNHCARPGFGTSAASTSRRSSFEASIKSRSRRKSNDEQQAAVKQDFWLKSTQKDPSMARDGKPKQQCQVINDEHGLIR